MPRRKSDEDALMERVRREEDDYLRSVTSTKPRSCGEDGLYKLCAKMDGSGIKRSRSQEGGFIGAILPLLRLAGPFIIDYALNKFTGSGFAYRYQNGGELSLSDKKHILLKIITEHPYLTERLFE